MSSELKFREQQSGDSVRIDISGEVDIYTSQQLKEKLYHVIDSTQLDLKIDCSEMDYIDSTGLGVFVGALKRAKQYGKDIFLLNMKENIKKLFNITGLDKLFIIGE